MRCWSYNFKQALHDKALARASTSFRVIVSRYTVWWPFDGPSFSNAPSLFDEKVHQVDFISLYQQTHRVLFPLQLYFFKTYWVSFVLSANLLAWNEQKKVQWAIGENTTTEHWLPGLSVEFRKSWRPISRTLIGQTIFPNARLTDKTFLFKLTLQCQCFICKTSNLYMCLALLPRVGDCKFVIIFHVNYVC